MGASLPNSTVAGYRSDQFSIGVEDKPFTAGVSGVRSGVSVYDQSGRHVWGHRCKDDGGGGGGGANRDQTDTVVFVLFFLDEENSNIDRFR